jgi:hypothetical protein
MSSILKPVSVALLALALTGPLSAAKTAKLEPGKWCPLVNNSKDKVPVVLTDFKLVGGHVYIKGEKEAGNGTELAKPNDSTSLDPGTRYLMYFHDPTGVFGLTLKFGNGKTSTTMNFHRLPKLGDTLTVDVGKGTIGGESLSNSHLTVNFGAFRRSGKGDFIVINP